MRHPLIQREENRNGALADIVKTDGIVLYSGLRLIPQRQCAIQKVIRNPTDRRRDPDVQDLVIARHERLQFIEILADERCAFAVVAVEEIVVQRRDVLVRIPQQLRQQPSSKFREFRMIALIGALLHQADDVVVAEEFHVALQTAEVRERAEIIGEIRRVVPDEQLVRHGAPAFDVLHEFHVLRIFGDIQRLGEIAFNCAEARHDVVARLDVHRRRPCILIRKRFDQRVRKLLLDRLRHLVHEPDQQAGLPAVFFRHRVAFLACAEIIDVVLADAVHRRRRILADARQQPLRRDFQHVRIRQTALHIAVAAGAADFRKVFRMSFIELAHGDELIHRVDEQAAAETHLSAFLFRKPHLVAVAFVAIGLRRVEHVIPERLAHQKRGNLHFVQIRRDFEFVQRRNNFAPRRIPTASAEALQNFIHAVHSATLPPVDDKSFADRLQPERVVWQFHFRKLTAGQFRQITRLADKNRLLRQRSAVVLYRQLHTRLAFDVHLQLVASQFDGFRGICRMDDHGVCGLPTMRDNKVGLYGSRCQTKQ